MFRLKNKLANFIKKKIGNENEQIKPQDTSTKFSPVRTPLSGSTGYISFIDDDSESFFGCGETGAIWKKKENLFRDIEKIISLYPHRKDCYVKKDESWFANSNEPNNIIDLIESEEDVDLAEYVQD
ncbi:MAG: hypothetical protein ACI8Q1_001394 [Parvicella sp.]|jgi:hypothetical protein